MMMLLFILFRPTMMVTLGVVVSFDVSVCFVMLVFPGGRVLGIFAFLFLQQIAVSSFCLGSCLDEEISFAGSRRI